MNPKIEAKQINSRPSIPKLKYIVTSHFTTIKKETLGTLQELFNQVNLWRNMQISHYIFLGCQRLLYPVWCGAHNSLPEYEMLPKGHSLFSQTLKRFHQEGNRTVIQRAYYASIFA